VFAEPALARRWLAILYRQGWAAPGWPVEYGGTGWPPLWRHIWEHECAEAGTPVLPGMGLQMCGPVLMKYGTEAQKEYFLPRIVSGEDYWCQGYSEPQAGSDLAALQCRAELVEGTYVINGSKIWTTHAHAANWIFLLVRTSNSGRPQQGITFLLCPMDSVGVTVRPIASMSGDHEINQVFLDGVRVPDGNRVGDENQGWEIAKYLLTFERSGGAKSARVKTILRRARSLASRAIRRGLPVIEDSDFRRRLAQAEMAQAVLEATEWKLLMSRQAGSPVQDVTASILKLRGSELIQEAAGVAMEAAGERGIGAHSHSAQGELVDWDHEVSWPAARYLNARADTIFGGSSEIQRDILARRLLDG